MDPATVTAEKPAITPRRGVTFLDLGDGQCRYPLGAKDDPPAWFCGDATALGEVYCAECRRKAYPPPRERR